MSWADDIADEPMDAATRTYIVTARERRLLAQTSWTTDELITLAFVARRLADRLDRALQGQP